MTNEPTPGDWQAEGLSIVVLDSNGLVHVGQAMSREADAKVMAASKVMLETLERAVSDLVRSSQPLGGPTALTRAIMDDMRRAIAIAKVG